MDEEEQQVRTAYRRMIAHIGLPFDLDAWLRAEAERQVRECAKKTRRAMKELRTGERVSQVDRQADASCLPAM